MPIFGIFGQFVNRPFFDEYIEKKHPKNTYANIADYEFCVAKQTNDHAPKQCFSQYNVGLRKCHVYMTQSNKTTLHNNCMWGFGTIKNMNVNGYYETKPEYARDEHNKLGFGELIHQIAKLYGGGG